MELAVSPLINGGQWTNSNSARHSTFLHRLLDIGELLMTSGTEVNRVEDTLAHVGKAYGVSYMDVFVVTTNTIITMVFPDGMERTQACHIRNGDPTDLTLLGDLNALSRRCCRQPLPIENLRERLDAIRSEPHLDFLYYANNMIDVGSFTAFLTGTVFDVTAASMLRLIVSAMRKRLGKITSALIVGNFVGSSLTGCLLGGAVRALPFPHMNAIMIGGVILSVPDIAMANAVRDVLSGDIMAGIMHILEDLLWIAALACGFMASPALINMLS